MSIAQHVIAKCGGPATVAVMTGVHVSRVHRWTYPKERGGTGGLIPAQHQQVILAEAKSRGIALSPSDFFEPLPDAASVICDHGERAEGVMLSPARVADGDGA